MIFIASFYPYWFLSYKGVVTYTPPPTIAKLAETSTGARVKTVADGDGKRARKSRTIGGR